MKYQQLVTKLYLLIAAYVFCTLFSVQVFTNVNFVPVLYKYKKYYLEALKPQYRNSFFNFNTQSPLTSIMKFKNSVEH